MPVASLGTCSPYPPLNHHRKDHGLTFYQIIGGEATHQVNTVLTGFDFCGGVDLTMSINRPATAPRKEPLPGMLAIQPPKRLLANILFVATTAVV